MKAVPEMPADFTGAVHGQQEKPSAKHRCQSIPAGGKTAPKQKNDRDEGFQSGSRKS